MTKENKEITLEELKKHNSKDDAWIAVDDIVYDVTSFAKRHPGGEKLMLFFAGQDASDPFYSFHIRPEFSFKIMKKLKVGTFIGSKDNTENDSPMLRDFRKLRKDLKDEGYFQAKISFFMAWFAHVVFMELLAIYIAYATEGSNNGWWACVALLCIAQIQAGWLQHDFGHLAVFKTIKTNDFWHKLTIMHLKGASAQWWKTRHNRHHAKTNVLKADPDIDNDPLFLFGEEMSKYRKGWQFTRYQHLYWWLIGPPLVTSLLFVYQVLKFIYRRKLKEEAIWIGSYFLRFSISFVPLFGIWNSILLYWSMRVLESMWFTWITSMSHLPMQIESDKDDDWVTHTVNTTQNLAGGLFNDWFTGHLNYQIEHHLFPTMPRHSYAAINPRIKALCKKHGLNMRTRPLASAAWDVVVALQETGQLYDHNNTKKSKKHQ